MMGRPVLSVIRSCAQRFPWPATLSLAAILLSLTLVGCGDYFRPVAIPVLRPGGDPSLLHTAVVVNQNIGGTAGGTTHVDISGDTNVGNFTVGRGPVHASIISTLRVLTANPGDNTVSFYGFSSPGSVVNTVTLPTNADPIFIGGAESANSYVVMKGINQVGVISTNSGSLIGTINVGNSPVALAETGDFNKLYVVNQGDGTVSVVSLFDRSVLTTIAVGANPSWGVLSADSTQFFVVNTGSGTVSVIDTTADAVIATIPAGVAPNYCFFDSHLLRLLVTDPVGGSVTVIRTDTTPPVALATITTVGKAPISVTALQDGTRFYVANAGDQVPCTDGSNGTACGTVTIIDAVGLFRRATITVGTNPTFIASSPDSIRVVVANKGSGLGIDPACAGATPSLSVCGSITSIQTSTDSVINTLTPGAPNPMFIAIQ